MKVFISVIAIFFTLSSHAKNLGHRAGGGKKKHYKTVPENSLAALYYSLNGKDAQAPLQDHKDFLYLEFDVQETYDGKLVVFHDKDLKRLFPRAGLNRKVYESFYKNKEIMGRHNRWERWTKKLKVKKMKLSELKQLHLGGMYNQRIPTLKEFLDACKKWKIKKPVAIEIKNLITHKAKTEFFNTAGEFQKTYMKSANIKFEKKYDMPFKTGFIAFSKNFRKSLKKRDYWCDIIRQKDLHGVFRIGRHDNLCK